MNLRDIKKLEIKKDRYDFMIACNDQHGADYRLYEYNGRYFNITKLHDNQLLDFINSLGKTPALKPKEYIFRLNCPFWSAWQHFGWDPGVCGFGIKDSICEDVISRGLTLVVKYKDESYRITAEKLKSAIDQYKSFFQVNVTVRLVVLPKFVFRKSSKRVKKFKAVERNIPLQGLGRETMKFISLTLF